MAKVVTLLALLCLVVWNVEAACRNPKVMSSTYSTGNVLMSSETVFIVEVTCECDGNKELSLHALVGDQLIPVATTVTTNQYQVSWKESHAKAITGRRHVKFFDDEGTAALKKSVRYGEELTAEPLFTVEVNHRGAVGSLWIAPSFVAMVIAVFVWWLAYTTKTKLQD